MEISPADTATSQVVNPARESQQTQREQDRNARAQQVNRSENLSSSASVESTSVAPPEPQVPASEAGSRPRYPASPDRVSLSSEALRASRQSDAENVGAVIDNDTGELVPQARSPEPQNRNAINAYVSVQRLAEQ